MSTGTSCHLLQVSKKSLRSLTLYDFFYDSIHVYSPGTGADSPQGASLMSTERPIINPATTKKFVLSFMAQSTTRSLLSLSVNSGTVPGQA